MPTREDAVENVVNGLICRALRPGAPAESFLFGTYDFKGNRKRDLDKERERENVRRAIGCSPTLPEDSRYLPEGVASGIGQCPVLYNFKGTFEILSPNGDVRSVDFSQGGAAANRRYGPFRGFRIGTNSANRSTLYLLHSRGDGASIESTIGSAPADGDIIRSPVLTSATRFDNQPDDCGAPADPRPRYEGNLDYEDGDGNPISEPATILIDAPRIDSSGNLTIPFKVQLPGIDLEGVVDVGIGATFGPGNNNNYGDRPISPDDGRPPSGEDDPPEPPEKYRPIIGVVAITTKETTTTLGTELGDGAPPTLFLPDMGKVFFAYDVAGGNAWGELSDITLKRQYFPVLGEIEAYAVRVVNRSGFLTELYPVTLDKEVEGD